MIDEILDATPGPLDRAASDCRKAIADCFRGEIELTEWETKFLRSILKQSQEGKRLSVRQLDTLNDIWSRTAEGSALPRE